MKILGINIASHDTSAALIVDGRLICAFEEERFKTLKSFHPPWAEISAIVHPFMAHLDAKV